MVSKLAKKILKTGFFRKIFLRKLSRVRESKFLERYSSDLRTLDIGAKSKENGRYFPNITTLNLEQHKDVDILADAENLGGLIENESFDIILCLSVLEHTKHPEKIIREIKRILKKEGLVIVTVPFIMSLHDTPDDYWRFTKYGLLELFKDFELVEIKENMNSLETMGYLYHRLFLQTEVLGTRALSIIFFIFSKCNYLFKKIITKEYGYINGKRQESYVLSNGILAVFRKKYE